MPRLTKPIITAHPRDARVAAIPVDFSPDTMRWLLDEGARGDLLLQNELFATMEDTWDRLRTNIQKCKNAVARLQWQIQPFAPRNGKPSPEATYKAAFVQEALDNQRAAVWEDQHDFPDTIYALLDSIGRGITVLEIDWHRAGRHYLPTGTRTVPYNALGFEIQNNMPGGLRLFPDRNRQNPRRFEQYPHKFLVGVYRGKSGHIAATATLRALAPYWLGRMLGWEWLALRAELFGIPIRWGTYDPNMDEAEIQRFASMVENMGTAAWAVFPQGTDLKLQSGAISGVAGSNEPTERLIQIADRACDLIFLGQTLTTQSEGVGSYAMAKVHRDVEIDQYEAYATYVAKVINHQLIPSIIELNWGTPAELPYLEFQINRPDHETDKVRRDKILFKDMGLPVSTQWLYERHRVPPPNPGEERFDQPLAPDTPSPGDDTATATHPAAAPSGGTGGTPAGIGQGLANATPNADLGTHSAPPPSGETSDPGGGSPPGFGTLESKQPKTKGAHASRGVGACSGPQSPSPPALHSSPSDGGAPSPHQPSPINHHPSKTCCPPASPKQLPPKQLQPVEARSESREELAARQAAGRARLQTLLAQAAAEGKQVYWDATLDDKTTDECQSRHGQPYGEAWTDPPPIHFNCRSTLEIR